MAKPAAGTTLNTSHPLSSGLSLYCPLLEGSGSTITDLVAGNNGTYTGVTAIWDSNADGPTLRFNHADGAYAEWAAPLAAWKDEPITVAVRCKRRGATSNNFDGIAGLSNGADNGWQVIISPLISSGGFADETWFIQTFGGSGGFGSGNAMALDDWVTIVFTHNGTTIHTYEDGTEIGTGNAAAAIATSSSTLMLGRRFNGDNTFQGDIECFAIWSRVLSGAEVADFSADPYQVLGAGAAEPEGSDEEFVGPFDNWRDVKVDYGAAGNGTGNDQTAFAAAVADMVAGVFHSLWVPAGDYRFTTGLYIQSLDRVSIIGEDPETTRIFWDAATVEFMALINFTGTHYSRLNRLELDGNDLAWCVLRVDGDTNGFFPTGNEFTDLHIHNAGGTDNADGHTYGAGVRLQAVESIGVSEAMFKRCHIHDNLTIDLMTGGYNTLDIWLRDCWFHDTPISIGNHSRIQTGAGNFHGYDCLFENASDTCILIGNTQGHNFERCWFRNSNRVYDSYGVGASSPTTFKRCTALDITQPVMFAQQNAGPMIFVDNVVRSLSPTETSYVAGSPNMIRGGNTYSTAGQSAGTRDLVFDTETVVARASITPTWPTWRGYQLRTDRPVFEVPPAASTATVQTAITNAVAAGGRAVVHLQGAPGSPPSHSITTTLEVPASDIQIIGDGRRTEVKWTGAGAGPIMNLQGPGAHPTLRELRFHGNDQVDGVRLFNADQVDGLVLFEQVFGEQNMVGWRFDHLADTKVEVRGDGVGSTGVGPPVGSSVYVNAAEVVQWGGAYGTNWNTCWTVSGGARVAIFHAWYEGEPPEEISLGVGSAFGNGFASGQFVRWGGIQVAPDANHGGNVGPNTATVHIEGFRGRVSLIGCGLGVLSNVRRWSSRHDAPLLVLGQMGTVKQDGTHYYRDDHPGSRGALLASNRQTRVDEVPTFSEGSAVSVSDVLTRLATGHRAAFVKEQLAWARTLTMVNLLTKDYEAGITNAQFYRVDFTRCINGIDVRGTLPSLTGTPSISDAFSQKVIWLVADAQVATFRKHAAFIDPVGNGQMFMPALAATGAPTVRTHRWCSWRMTPLQQEELEARLAAQITATTIKVYEAGETPAAVRTANSLVSLAG